MGQTVDALLGLGHEVHLVVYGFGMGEPGAREGLIIHRAPPWGGRRRIAAGPAMGKPLNDVALLKTLRRVCREHPVDVIDAHNYEGLMVALRAGAAPVVYHAHNAMEDELPHYFRGSRLAGRFGGWLDERFPRQASAVVAPHGFLAEYLVRNGCTAERVHVIPPAVRVDDFEPLRERVDDPPILYTGNLDRYQNLSFLEAVIARVRETVPRVPVHVATSAEGALPGALRIPTPDFSALREVLSRDAVVVCPRISWSGYPIKLLNAMAAGHAIIACASAAHPLVNGENGIVVRDNFEDAFAYDLVTLLQDRELRAHYGERARETVRAQHDPVKTGRALEDVLRSVV